MSLDILFGLMLILFTLIYIIIKNKPSFGEYNSAQPNTVKSFIRLFNNEVNFFSLSNMNNNNKEFKYKEFDFSEFNKEFQNRFPNQPLPSKEFLT
jgi:hypothetical protein